MDNPIYIKIAGFYIKIKFAKIEHAFSKEKIKKEISTYYQGFILNTKPKKIDFHIRFVEARDSLILTKNNHAFIGLYEETGLNEINTYYQISQMQLSLIIRHIIGKLLIENGFFLHASASNINGKANVFLGKSGSGKSTIIQLLKEKYLPLADDVIILKKENNKFYLYQTPFFEKNRVYSKKSKGFSLNSLFFLKKASFVKKERIRNKDIIFKKLIGQFFTEKQTINKQIPLLLDFVSTINNFYYLYFNKDKDSLLFIAAHTGNRTLRKKHFTSKIKALTDS